MGNFGVGKGQRQLRRLKLCQQLALLYKLADVDQDFSHHASAAKEQRHLVFWLDTSGCADRAGDRTSLDHDGLVGWFVALCLDRRQITVVDPPPSRCSNSYQQRDDPQSFYHRFGGRNHPKRWKKPFSPFRTIFVSMTKNFCAPVFSLRP